MSAAPSEMVETVALAIYANQCKGVDWGTVADPIEDAYPPYEEMADMLREDARAAIEAMEDSIARAIATERALIREAISDFTLQHTPIAGKSAYDIADDILAAAIRTEIAVL